MNNASICILSAALLVLILMPAAMARKCYICNSNQQPGCADANQISNLYTDCSQQQNLFGSGQQFQQQPGVPFNPQAPGGGQQFLPQQQQYGSGDRCFKTMIVQNNGPPMITRGCGTPVSNNMMVAGDGCVWTGNVQTCTCESNYCNGSKRLSISFSTSVFAAVLVSLLTFITYGRQ